MLPQSILAKVSMLDIALLEEEEGEQEEERGEGREERDGGK